MKGKAGIVGALVLGTVTLLSGSNSATAQGLILGGGATGPPVSGPGFVLRIPQQCWGAGYSSYWDDFLTLSVTATADGAGLGNGTFYGWGDEVDGTVPFEVEIGRADISIQCEAMLYSWFWGASASATASFQVAGRVVNSLVNIESEETWAFYGLGSYLRHRVYQAGDQYGFDFNYVDSTSEEYDPVDNGCNLSIATGPSELNEWGRVADDYGTTSGGQNIPACLYPQYQSCESRFRQYITVAGVPFDHEVIWSCYNVQVGR